MEQVELPTAVQSRMTVIETIYHQAPNDEPTSFTSRFSRSLETDEQPYARKLKVGESWQPLDRASIWLAEAGLLRLVNEEGTNWPTNPTPEQLAEVAAKVVEIGFGADTAAILVPPGESVRFSPADLALIRLRCRSGTARCALALLPR